MFLFIVNGLYVEIGCSTLDIVDIQFIYSFDFGVGGLGEGYLIIEFVGELFFANVSGLLLFGGEMETRKFLSVELVGISDSAPFAEVEGFAPFSPHL